MNEQPRPPGWYTVGPSVQHYWDGSQWVGQALPAAAPQTPARSAFWYIRVIALGIVVGVIALAMWVNLSQPSDADCAAQRADYALGNIAAHEVDPACR